VGRGGNLSPVWAGGAALYRALGRVDAALPATGWAEALAWIAARPGPVGEIQYWGHGRWGNARIRDDVLDAGALSAAHPLRPALEAVRARLAPDALLWFRTCETFGARRGLDFAERLADFLGARVAGHTHVIGFHQSGLHALRPGTRPDWSPEEGLAEGSADEPRRARGSRPWAPRTITCFHGTVPAAWYAGATPTPPDPAAR
jgi:hypothetical protein